VSEVAALKVTDIDSKRMMLRVEQGKGRKDLTQPHRVNGDGAEVVRRFHHRRFLFCSASWP
jgi:hypothetical protein